MHVVFLDPVAEDLGRGVALGEDELDEPRCLLLGRRLRLEATVLLVSCRKRLDELTDVWQSPGETENTVMTTLTDCFLKQSLETKVEKMSQINERL